MFYTSPMDGMGNDHLHHLHLGKVTWQWTKFSPSNTIFPGEFFLLNDGPGSRHFERTIWIPNQ